MKKILALIMVVGMLALAASALACTPSNCAPGITKTWIDLNDPTPNIWFGNGGVNDYSFTFDITTAGFIPGTDLVKQYDLLIDFADDRDLALEIAKITIEGGVGYSFWGWDFNLNNVHITGTSTLNTNGTLAVALHRVYGDFWYNDAKLSADGCDNPTSVPEPTTMLLLGLGLIGVAGIRRFKK